MRVVLVGTDVTDAGLPHLRDLTQLRSLNLDDTQITDSGLAHLKGMTQLEGVEPLGHAVTDAGLDTSRA